MDRNYTLQEMIERSVSNKLSYFHTALPGKILSFDAPTQRATIQPVINRVTPEGNIQSLPLLYDVPVIMPHSGGYSITLPVKENDECLVIVCERSITNYLSTSEVSLPAHYEKGSLTDAIAIVGFGSIKKTIKDYDNEAINIRNDSGNIKIKLSQNDIKLTTDKSTISTDTTGNVSVNAQNVTISAGNITIGSKTTIDGKEFLKHKHSAGSYVAEKGVSGISGEVA